MHITTQILGQTVNADTLYFAWACMAFILLSGFFLTVGASDDTAKFSSRQHVAEGLYGFIRGIVKDQIGKRADGFVFFIGSIFIFVLIGYYAGLLPWKMGSMFDWWPQMPVPEQLAEHTAAAAEHAQAGAEHAAAVAHEASAHHASHPWHGASPCADININAGMAILVILLYFITGTVIAGFKYIQLYLPINFTSKGIKLNFLCLIELLDLIVRPLTLSLRLFANTFAGETLVATFVGLLPLVLPALALGFEMAVGVLQAYLFMILSTVYIAGAVKHAEHLVHDHHH